MASMAQTKTGRNAIKEHFIIAILARRNRISRAFLIFITAKQASVGERRAGCRSSTEGLAHPDQRSEVRRRIGKGSKMGVSGMVPWKRGRCRALLAL